MRFKSENGFSSLCVPVLSAAAFFAAGVGSTYAQTPTPSPSATPVPTIFLHPPDPYVWTRESGAVYIARLTSAAHGVNTREGYKSWEISTTSASAGTTSTDDMFYFDFEINESIAATAGNRLVVTVESEVLSGTPTHKFIPIAAVGDVRCSGNASCLYNYRAPNVDQTSGTVTSGVALAADFGGSAPRAIRVGFFFGDICAALGNGGVRPYGCSESLTTSPAIPTDGAPTQFSLVFRLRQVSQTLATPESTTLAAATATKELKAVITVQSNGPTVSCTTTDIYFPGDQQILVDTSKIVGSIASGGAPIHEVVVTAEKDPGTLSATIPPSLDDDVVAYIAPTGTHGAGTFENTVTGNTDDNEYTVQFNVMDQAGVMPLPAAGCQLSNVQTSEIQSFLGSNACFIATASFQSTHHPVVEELRTFRDQILARSWLGRKFVALYYRWSPRAAAVVDQHPWLRIPSLFLLAPFEFVAALLLRPLLAAGWILGWSGLGFLLFVNRRRSPGALS